MSDQPGQGDHSAALDALLRAAHKRLDGLHLPYRHAVDAALEDRHGISVDDQSSTPSEAPVRAFALWLDPDGPLRATWSETDGWAMHDVPAADGTVHAPLDILAAPDAVADWIAATLVSHPTPGQPATPRKPTSQATVTAQDLAFEQTLVSYRHEPEFAPVPVEPPAQPRSSRMAWNAPLKHRCMSCPPGDGRRPWTRRESGNHALTAISARTMTVYTGWCLTCHPDALHMRDPERELLDNKVLSGHNSGRFRGSLLLTIVGKFVCPVCMAPWLLYPEASLPLAYGRLEDVRLNLHPCPWCWAADEPRARREHDDALNRLW